MENVKGHGVSGATGLSLPPLVLPASIPEVTQDELDGALRRSPRARRLHARLKAREAADKPLTGAEVENVVKGATRVGGKPDGDQAVVIAEHARKHPTCFGGAHEFLIRFLARLDWRALLADLRAFIAELRAEEAEQQKRDDVKNELEVDRLELDRRRDTLLRMERVRVASLPPVDRELDASNRLRLTLERLKRS